MDNIITISAIIGKQRQGHKSTFLFLQTQKKCLDKLWLKEYLIEMEEIGYNRSDIKMLQETNKKKKLSQIQQWAKLKASL